jgi:hypothetical protein
MRWSSRVCPCGRCREPRRPSQRFYRESAVSDPHGLSPAAWPLPLSSTIVLFRRGCGRPLRPELAALMGFSPDRLLVWMPLVAWAGGCAVTLLYFCAAQGPSDYFISSEERGSLRRQSWPSTRERERSAGLRIAVSFGRITMRSLRMQRRAPHRRRGLGRISCVED